jgi:hypothetical protein
MNEELALRAVLALESMAAPNWVDIGGLIIGLAQCGLIYYVLRLMSQGSTERTTQLTARHEETMTAMKTQHEETMTAHEASMTALTELIRRTAPHP